MSELVAFLEQRLAEDEAVARAASRGPWALDEDDTAVRAASGAGPSVCTTVPLGHERRRANATHVARHDPARVLREVAAKRAILGLHPRIADERGGHCYWCSDDDQLEQYPCRTVRALAAPFGDHPDFQEQWR